MVTSLMSGGGVAWSDSYVQCIVSDFLLSVRFRLDFDSRRCDEQLVMTLVRDEVTSLAAAEASMLRSREYDTPKRQLYLLPDSG